MAVADGRSPNSFAAAILRFLRIGVREADRTGTQAVTGQRLAVAAQAIAERRGFVGAAEVGDAAMAAIDQVIHGEPQPVDAVGDHRRHVEAIDRAIDEHEGEPFGLERREISWLVMRGRQDQAVHAPIAQEIDELALLLLGVAGAADDQRVAVALGLLLRRHGEAGPERVGEVADGEAERVGAVVLEVTGEGGGAVAHVLGRALDAGGGLRADAEFLVAPAQHMRHRRLRDPEAFGDVLHSHAHSGRQYTARRSLAPMRRANSH